MKKGIHIIILIITCLSFSCKKEGCTDEYAVNYDVKAKKDNNKFCIYKKPDYKEYVPYFGQNTATLVAIDNEVYTYSSKWGPISTWSYALGARFSINGEVLVAAGNVSMSIYSQEPVTYPSPYNIVFSKLNKQVDNSYTREHSYLPQMPPSYFPNPLEWRATGDIWPSFTLFNSRGFSGNSVIHSGEPIISSSYTFKVSPMTDADSLALEIIGQRKHITKVIPASANSHVFSQEEIESVGKGNAILRVVSVRYDKQNVGSETYYLLNTKRSSKEVIIK